MATEKKQIEMYVKYIEKKKMEASSSATSYFNIFITGQLESATFPLGPEASEIFCRYESVAGPDWEFVSGFKQGVTQYASNKSGNFNDPIVFNMPIEFTYRSSNSFGCTYSVSKEKM